MNRIERPSDTPSSAQRFPLLDQLEYDPSSRGPVVTDFPHRLLVLDRQGYGDTRGTYERINLRQRAGDLVARDRPLEAADV